MKCPYCNKQAEFVSSKDFYGTDYGTNLYVCYSCDARVGTHKKSAKPLGTMANEELRQLRMKCHRVFDVKWKSGKMTRNKAYEWLQKNMDLSSEEAHIGRFNKSQCNQLLNILKETD